MCAAGCCSTRSSTRRRRLRRELALPPVETRPADLVDAAEPGAAVPARRARLALRRPGAARPAARPAAGASGRRRLQRDEDRLSRPVAGEAAQPAATGLSNLAARSGAEVTCCFDGPRWRAGCPRARAASGCCSASRETADELIRRLVRAEPTAGRSAVVSSDREVADGVSGPARARCRRPPAARLDRALMRITHPGSSYMTMNRHPNGHTLSPAWAKGAKSDSCG